MRSWKSLRARLRREAMVPGEPCYQTGDFGHAQLLDVTQHQHDAELFGHRRGDASEKLASLPSFYGIVGRGFFCNSPVEIGVVVFRNAAAQLACRPEPPARQCRQETTFRVPVPFPKAASSGPGTPAVRRHRRRPRVHQSDARAAAKRTAEIAAPGPRPLPGRLGPRHERCRPTRSPVCSSRHSRP